MYAIDILYFLRQRAANDWLSLCAVLGINRPYDTQARMAAHALAELASLGFVSVDSWPAAPGPYVSYELGDWPFGDSPPVGQIKLAPHWSRVQALLGVSLTNLRRLLHREVVLAQPLFGKPRSGFRPDVFVIMPFATELQPIYREHIRKVVKQVRVNRCVLSIGRADDFFASRPIIRDVWESIYEAQLIIADCTSRNANVFY